MSLVCPESSRDWDPITADFTYIRWLGDRNRAADKNNMGQSDPQLPQAPAEMGEGC
jgi:hypothetical protein